MYVAIALVGLFLVWAVAVQVGARRQEVAVVSLSGPEAQAVVQSVLGGKRFQWVEGPGQVNAKPRRKWRAPTISVDVEPRTDAYGSRIEIWLGAFRVQAGLIQQPNYAWRMKRKVRGRLEAADAQALEQAAAGASAPSAPGPAPAPGVASPYSGPPVQNDPGAEGW